VRIFLKHTATVRFRARQIRDRPAEARGGLIRSRCPGPGARASLSHVPASVPRKKSTTGPPIYDRSISWVESLILQFSMHLQNREVRRVRGRQLLSIGHTTCSFVMHLYLEEKLVSACATFFSCPSCGKNDYFLTLCAICLSSILFGISWDTALDQATIHLSPRRTIQVAVFSGTTLWLLKSYISNCRTESSKIALDEALFFLALFHVVPPLCNSVAILHVNCVTYVTAAVAAPCPRYACTSSWRSNLCNLMLVVAPLLIWQDCQCTWLHLLVGSAFLVALAVMSVLLSGPWNTSHSWTRVILFAGNLLLSAWIHHACAISNHLPSCKFYAVTTHAPVASHTLAKFNFFNEEKSHSVLIWNFPKILAALRWAVKFSWHPLLSLLVVTSKTLWYHECGSQEHARCRGQDDGGDSGAVSCPDEQQRLYRRARHGVPPASTTSESPTLCCTEQAHRSDSDDDVSSLGEPAPDLLLDSADDCAASASAAPTRPGSHDTGPGGAAVRMSSQALSVGLETGWSPSTRHAPALQSAPPGQITRPGLGPQHPQPGGGVTWEMQAQELLGARAAPSCEDLAGVLRLPNNEEQHVGGAQGAGGHEQQQAPAAASYEQQQAASNEQACPAAAVPPCCPPAAAAGRMQRAERSRAASGPGPEPADGLQASRGPPGREEPRPTARPVSRSPGREEPRPRRHAPTAAPRPLEPPPRREHPDVRGARAGRLARSVAHDVGAGQAQRAGLRQAGAASDSSSRARPVTLAQSAASRAAAAVPQPAGGAGGEAHGGSSPPGTGAAGARAGAGPSHGPDDARTGSTTGRRPGPIRDAPARTGDAWRRWGRASRGRLTQAEAEAEADVWDTCRAGWDSDEDLARWARALPT
jgi:hypothetical protein